ncbi:MAG TPA: redoxin domain-containing protein [Candidatus Latescibacteria bacterium]|nr:redoxin domain-containing protein [Candidatus Handelsmanbacteria bacterium]HIL07571.1 redoxin domain-containing protein [Candidatus Latescibacterota bacterium]
MNVCIQRFVAAIAIGLIVCSTAIAQLVEVGDSAPEFELQALGGGSLELDDLRGQIVVIVFLGYN